MTIDEFLEQDKKKLEEIINKYPKQIPSTVIAELLGCSPSAVRSSIESNGQLGIHWRLPGKLTSGNCIPTAKFVYWYLNQQVIS